MRVELPDRSAVSGCAPNPARASRAPLFAGRLDPWMRGARRVVQVRRLVW